MITQEIYDDICEQGYGGVCIWRSAHGDRYMGCLIDKDYTPLHNTNCWNWHFSLAGVCEELQKTARRLGGKSK